MQYSQKTASSAHRFDIFLFDAFSNHCLANTVEPLRAANMLSDRPLYEWRFCTLDGGSVQSSSGLQVAPHGGLAEASGHTLIVMPSYGVRRIAPRDVGRALFKVAPHYGRLAGFDTGSWLLAQAGLLDGYRATIHWDELTAFSERFPDVEAVRERFVIDRDRITCSGAMAAFDLIIHLIASDHGPLLAMDVTQLFMSRDAVDQRLPYKAGGGKTVNRALAIMQDSVEAPLTIPALARAVGCTQKTLELRMHAALQATPQAVYRHLRLTRARQLVMNTDLPITEISQRCGYENASAMTRAFRVLFGHAPSALRKAGG
ncbi:GlxA family transcriptional regulator [Tateyamaria pelophila]|uniref:GlxA family transcriptional regulator n=1 Tax=Tateyamaria pelophila TaxID=328415 RepID=UPI001CBAD89A|nr:GlxA family transcriptional regulator [Tateyamaria pelophila]